MRWMQLSDLHYGYKATTADTMRRNLLEKAESLGKIDALFITGDLRYAKECPDEYPPDTLKAVQEFILRTDLTTARYYVYYDILTETSDEDFTFYTDDSIADEPLYTCNRNDSTVYDAITYITSRMERLGFAVPPEPDRPQTCETNQDNQTGGTQE